MEMKNMRMRKRIVSVSGKGRFKGMIIHIFFSLRKKKSRFNGHGRSVLE